MVPLLPCLALTFLSFPFLAISLYVFVFILLTSFPVYRYLPAYLPYQSSVQSILSIYLSVYLSIPWRWVLLLDDVGCIWWHVLRVFRVWPCSQIVLCLANGCAVGTCYERAC